jgi:hypothetical protein
MSGPLPEHFVEKGLQYANRDRKTKKEVSGPGIQESTPEIRPLECPYAEFMGKSHKKR